MGNRVRNTTWGPALLHGGALYFLHEAQLHEILPPEDHLKIMFATGLFSGLLIAYFFVYWYILSGKFSIKNDMDTELILRYALTDKKAEVGDGWAWSPQLRYWVAGCGAAVLVGYVVFLFTW